MVKQVTGEGHPHILSMLVSACLLNGKEFRLYEHHCFTGRTKKEIS